MSRKKRALKKDVRIKSLTHLTFDEEDIKRYMVKLSPEQRKKIIDFALEVHRQVEAEEKKKHERGNP